MGITKLFDNFYRRLPDETFQKDFITGQFCYIAAFQLEVVPWVLEVKRSDPTGHLNIDFDVRKLSEKDYCRTEELPIYYLGLRYNEELIVQKSKRRPGIIIASENIIFDDISHILKNKKKHLQQKCVLVVPIFSRSTTISPSGFPPEMVARIKALMYKQYFYCPQPPKGFKTIEGISRLDRIQVIATSSFPSNKRVFEPVNMAFTDEVTAVFIGMIREWLGIPGRPEDIDYLKTIKDIVAETLPPS